MRRSLLILLVACTLVVAMVPRHRRAQDTENGKDEGNMYCEEQTPCFWSIYKSGFRNLIKLNVTNTYCICTPSQSCSFSHEDEVASTYVYRCKEDS